MKLRWFIPSIVTTTTLLFATKAFANQLTSWQFNPSQNQLDISTDSGIQPQAFVLTNPQRVVIDLPNTKLNKPTIRQQYNNLVKEIRVAQANENTTRVVVEFANGYGVTPDRVKIQGDSPSRWRIQLNQITAQPNTNTEIKQPIAIQSPVFAGVLPIGKELSGLETEIKALMQKYDSLSPGLFFIDVETGNYIDINGEKSFPAASTIKFPILVALFEAVESGKVRLDETLTVRRDLITGGSGDLQNSPGAKLTVLETATKMSVISDNTATNMIIDRLGGKTWLNQRFQAWGLQKTIIRNMLGDFKGTNTSSPADLVRLSALIAKHQLISDTSRAQLLDIMNQTENRRLLPSGLGKGAAIAHKTGTLGVLLGDAGIIERPNGKLYLAGVFVRRPFNDLRAFDFIKEVSKITYNYFNDSPISQSESSLILGN